jgi:hypothetical protein
MNFRTTLILLILLCGAAVFIFFARQSGEPDKNAQQQTNNENGRQLLTIKSEVATKLVIRPGPGAAAGTPTIELIRADGKWKLAQPINWGTSLTEQAQLLDAVTSVKSDRAIDISGNQAAATGLDKPRLLIEVSDAAGKTEKLAIGQLSPLGYLYVRANDEKDGSLVSGGTLSQLLKGDLNELVSSLRDKHPIQVAQTAVKQVRIERGPRQPELVLEKPQEHWKLVKPTQVPAEDPEVSDMISSLTSLEADSFAAPNTDVGLAFDQPRAVITLSTAAPATQPGTAPTATAPATLAGATRITIGEAEIGGDKCWIKVGSTPPVLARVSISKATLEKFTKATPLSLRDRNVLDLDPERVVEVSITTEESSTTQPAKSHTVQLRKRNELEMGPPKPAAPAASQPATQPATQPTAAAAFVSLITLLEADAPATQSATVPAATQPVATPATGPAATQPGTQPATRAAATQPAVAVEPPKPPTKWLLTSSGDARGDDAGVTDLLSRICKLRAMKYLDKIPASAPQATTYVVKLKLSGPGAPTQRVEIRFIDTGDNKTLVGRYGDQIFEVEHSLLNLLKKDFTEPPPGSAPSPQFDPRMMQQFHPGGVPGLPPGIPPEE